MLRHLAAIALLPGTVAGIVPATIVWRSAVEIGWGLPAWLAPLPIAIGAVAIGIGLALMIWTVTLFVTVGRGTLAPWDPTTELVVRGPYRHVRHPMISGVLCLLLGEAVLLGSPQLLVWWGIVLAVNAVYLPLVEERGLSRRFGSAYEDYRGSVPRWLPRRRGR
jgi:protein-S-isoprenylcysteine O-methyltransferase Ste14